ncbi:hypothetical protein IMCC12053_2067 [Celeribacter marinus]|uniref:Uncharacterized protein n=1 Tax=Celeribacter marinus TaxID=1397108 RepID=A0A0P0ACX6_9RHOB|nr:hypothetical protein IMCC12053_2067 [Celeribacter marinus]
MIQPHEHNTQFRARPFYPQGSITDGRQHLGVPPHWRAARYPK